MTSETAREPRPVLTEGELIDRMLAGDEAAFATFADDYLPPLYRFTLARLAGNRELSRDIVQSTVCKAIAKLDTFRGEAQLFTWLCSCCRREIAGHFRKQQRFEQRIDAGVIDLEAVPLAPDLAPDSPESALLRHETAQLVHSTLDELPPHYSRVLEWKYVDGVSVKEIARRLELGPKAAESLLTRARNAFKGQYERSRPPAATAEVLPT